MLEDKSPGWCSSYKVCSHCLLHTCGVLCVVYKNLAAKSHIFLQVEARQYTVWAFLYLWIYMHCINYYYVVYCLNGTFLRQ